MRKRLTISVQCCISYREQSFVLHCSFDANQMTHFYMKCNTALKWVNKGFTSMYDNESNFIKTQLSADVNML